MFERALNIFWILLGGAAAAYAWTLGLVGSSGPDSGLFPFISALIVMGAGVVLLVRSPGEPVAPDFPRGGIPYLGFAVAGFITMIILLRAVEKSGWMFSISLAFISVVVVVWLFGRVLGMTLPRGPWGW